MKNNMILNLIVAAIVAITGTFVYAANLVCKPGEMMTRSIPPQCIPAPKAAQPICKPGEVLTRSTPPQCVPVQTAAQPAKSSEAPGESFEEFAETEEETPSTQFAEQPEESISSDLFEQGEFSSDPEGLDDDWY